jgi:hypothetical protein
MDLNKIQTILALSVNKQYVGDTRGQNTGLLVFGLLE